MHIDEFVSGWHEHELPREVVQRGRLQPFELRLAGTPHAALVEHEHVGRRLEAELDALAARDLDDLGCHAGPAHARSRHAFGWSDRDPVQRQLQSGPAAQELVLLPIGSRPIGRGDSAVHDFVVGNLPVQDVPVQDVEAAVQQLKRRVTRGFAPIEARG